MSTDGTGAGTRTLLGMRKAELVRLGIVVAVAIGAVVLVEALSGSGHQSGHGSSSGHGLSLTVKPAGATGGAGGASAYDGSPASSPGHEVAVAGGAAVASSIRHGVLTVVIDQPPAGALSQENRAIDQGATVAVSQLNATGGLPGHVHVNLVTKTLDGLSPSALQARLHGEAAAALILPCDTDSQFTLAEKAAQYGVLMFAPCNPDPAAGQRYPTYWPVGMSGSDEALGLANFLHIQGYHKVFVVSAPGSRYVELATSAFRAAAQSVGIAVVGTASTSLAGPEFPPLARAIQTSGTKLVFTALPPPEVDRLAAGLQAQGVHQTILGTSAMDTPLTLSDAHGMLENATFASYGFTREDAAGRRFIAAYTSQFHVAPEGSFPGLGFETIRLLEDAVRERGSAEPASVQGVLTDGVTLSGVGLASRSYARDGNHNPVGVVSITKVAENHLLPLTATLPNGEPG